MSVAVTVTLSLGVCAATGVQRITPVLASMIIPLGDCVNW